MLPLHQGYIFGGDDWSRTSSARRAADLQSTGVTNFPTSPNLYGGTSVSRTQHQWIMSPLL